MEKWQLQQLQSLPLEVKIRKTQERIKEWYEHFDGQVYVSFSGGKDSTVLLHIARQMYPDIEAVFVDTGLEYPEIRDFVKTFDNVTWLRPKMNFKQVIEKYGYPVISKEVALKVSNVIKNPDSKYKLRFDKNSDYNIKYKQRYSLERYSYLLKAPFKISDKCCNVMKKKPAKEYEQQTGNKPIIATMTEESAVRQTSWLKSGCNAFDNGRPISTPMSFWTEQDVLQYLLKFSIPYAIVYGDITEQEQIKGQMTLCGYNKCNLAATGMRRTGCMFCMFGITQDREPNRFQMMKETHPKQYDYCINKLGLGKVLDYIHVKY